MLLQGDLIAGQSALVHVLDSVLLPTTQWSKFCLYKADELRV